VNSDAREPWQLRTFSLPVRLVLALFLISVGLGYLSALVQLHFQHASAGRLLPDADDAVSIYFGKTSASQLERLLTADESRPFDGSGTMRPAFTTKSARWKRLIQERAQEKNLLTTEGSPDLVRAQADLRKERDGERLALVAWIQAGAPQDAYNNDAFSLPAELARHPITEQYAETVGAEKSVRVKIKSMIVDRCERCHHEGGQASQFPLGTFEQIHDYCAVETAQGGMSLKKLAQTTHVHLLGFSMLYGLTGLVFAFSSYPAWFRAILGPFPLLAQLVDISCWWLGRLDAFYAKLIVFSGAAVALGLFLQIILSLFNLFGRRGKLVLALLCLLTAWGGYELKEHIIGPYLLREAPVATSRSDESLSELLIRFGA
jgi:hypothetical protein